MRSLVVTPEEALSGESKVRRENARLKKDLAVAEQRLDELVAELRIMEGFNSLNPDPPKWQVRAEKKKQQSFVVTMLSDLHLDEVVDPYQIPGNEYNRRIATERVSRWADQIAQLATDGHDGLVILWGGDMVTGEIHDELMRTNEDSVLGTCLYWSEILGAAFNLIAEQWDGRVKVYVTYGNHGRVDKKMQLKDYVRRNHDWLLAHMVARMTDLEWHIPEEIDCQFQLFDRTHVLTHGNHGVGRGGGGGIGGLWPPIMRMAARMREEYGARNLVLEHIWMGHWHTPTFGRGWTINGSTKGPDEYTRSLRIAPEAPSQIYEVWHTEGAVSKGIIRV